MHSVRLKCERPLTRKLAQFSLAVNIQIFAGVSGEFTSRQTSIGMHSDGDVIAGGVFNPAVSLGLALIGAHTPIRAMILTVAQMLGSIAGAAITSALLPGCVLRHPQLLHTAVAELTTETRIRTRPLNVRTTLVAGTSVARGLFIEMFLTA